MTTRFLAVVNPAAGHGRCGKLVGPALERLRAAGIELDVVESGYPGHGTELVREAYGEGYCRFISVGGDGTSFEIVNGLFPEALNDEPPTLAFQPLGTGNSFLRDFTDRGLEHATKALIAGRSCPCDVVKLTHRDGVIYYINILSLGFVADVCALTNRRFKWMGSLGYALAVMLCLARFKRDEFPIRVDGGAEPDRTRTALLIFNNSKFTGGHMMLAPHADTNDGLVEIVRWSVGRLGFIFNFLKMYDGSHIAHPAIWHHGTKRVDFSFAGPMDIMVDGEVLTLHCQSLEVLPSALRVMV
ncbi:MAG: diacylglycerol kinase family lipid kinase [Acidobacteria bacterium]|nr:diacylglycerol kinase family lipid kinase [Acidobacteriota bacterium]